MSDQYNKDQDPITDNEDKANIWNNYFASIFVNEPINAIPVFDINYYGTPVTQITIEKDNLFKRLQSLNVNTSTEYAIPKS